MQISPQAIESSPATALSMFNTPDNPFWDASPGIQMMRRVAVDTKMDTPERMRAAQQAMPYIADLVSKLKTQIGIARLTPGRTGQAAKEAYARILKLSDAIERVKRDPRYAQKAYNFFPLIAQKYGSGTMQVTDAAWRLRAGENRLPFDDKIKTDPLCTWIFR